MKIISGLLGFLILSLVLCFALSNRQDTSVALWPLNGALQLPLYLLTLAPLLFGLIFGGLCGWLASVPLRLRTRRLHKEVNALNNQIGEMKKTAVAAPTPRKSFWRYKS